MVSDNLSSPGSRMKIACFDPFSGASGDMVLGALVAAGASLTEISLELAKLKLPISLSCEKVDKNAVRGVRVSVAASDGNASRTWSDIRELIARSALSESVTTRALQVFQSLAEVEAHVHGVAVDDVHFHEVGGLDAIADICG